MPDKFFVVSESAANRGEQLRFAHFDDKAHAYAYAQSEADNGRMGYVAEGRPDNLALGESDKIIANFKPNEPLQNPPDLEDEPAALEERVEALEEKVDEPLPPPVVEPTPAAVAAAPAEKVEELEERVEDLEEKETPALPPSPTPAAAVEPVLIPAEPLSEPVEETIEEPAAARKRRGLHLGRR